MRTGLGHRAIDEFWRCFISLRLTFVLLGFLGLGAVLGMSYDQTLSYEEFLNKSHTLQAASLINFFELYDAFHSWWFSLVILLLSANLIACSFERLPRIYFDVVRPRPYLTDRRLLGLTLKKEIMVPTLDQARACISKFFGSPAEASRLAKAPYYFKARHTAGRFGVYVVHIALLIVMYSSIYTTQNGVDGHVLIEEGERTRFISAKGPGGVLYNYDLGFYVGCDDFRLSTFLDNSAMEFESDLNISLESSTPIARQTVRVNEPLSYAGFTFYQSSYTPVLSDKIVELQVGDAQGFSERHRVRLNESVLLPNGDKLIPEKIYDDFGGLGQALRLANHSPDGQSSYFHIFRKYPDFDKQVREGPYYAIFLGADQKYATGLSIGKVPGISLIFSGFLLFLLGLYMCFFMSPVRYFARIDQEKDGFKVIMAAQGFRHLAALKQDFDKH